jgi:hypothetical protein
MKVAHRCADERGTTSERVGRPCDDVNTALSTVILCIDFLAERADGVGGETTHDARSAVRRIATTIETLRDDEAREDSSPKTSAVLRRSDPPQSEGERLSEPLRHGSGCR